MALFEWKGKNAQRSILFFIYFNNEKFIFLIPLLRFIAWWIGRKCNIFPTLICTQSSRISQSWESQMRITNYRISKKNLWNKFVKYRRSKLLLLKLFSSPVCDVLTSTSDLCCELSLLIDISVIFSNANLFRFKWESREHFREDTMKIQLRFNSTLEHFIKFQFIKSANRRK